MTATERRNQPTRRAARVPVVHRTRLAAPVRKLLQESADRPSTVGELLVVAGRFLDLSSDLRHFVEYIGVLGELIDQADLATVTRGLDEVAARLLSYEQDPLLRTEGLLLARREVVAGCIVIGFDEQPVTCGVVADLSAPSDRLAGFLVRSLSGRGRIEESVLFNAPAWFARYLAACGQRDGVRLVDVIGGSTDAAVLEAAAALWQPLVSRDSSAFSTIGAAVTAARQLI